MNRTYFRHPGRRGVSPVIASVLLISLTMVLVATLYFLVRTPLPPQAPYVGFDTQNNATLVELIGSGTLKPGGSGCPATTGNTCFIRGSTFTISQTSSPSPPISLIVVDYKCNGSLVLSAPLSAITASNALAGGASSTTNGGICGLHSTANYCTAGTTGTPAQCIAGGMNCFGAAGPGQPLYNVLYYTPITSTQTSLQAGDTFTVYLGGDCISPSIDPFPGSLLFGPPPWCNVDPGACTITLLYNGSPQTVVGSFSLATLPGTYQ